MSDAVAITGTLSTSTLNPLPSGWPRLTVSVSDANGQLLGFCSAQASASPWAFGLYLDPTRVSSNALMTLEARCLSDVAGGTELARKTLTLPLAKLAQARLDIDLDAPGIVAPQPQDDSTASPLITLKGHVSIPPALRQAAAFLDATVLVIQEDGHSNRYASNLSEHSLLLKDDSEGAPFSLSIDPATLPEGLQLKLHLGLYDLERRTILAGHVIKGLDLTSPPDLTALRLRAPRH